MRDFDSQSIVVDCVAPLVAVPRYVKRQVATLKAGHVDAVLATSSSIEPLQQVAENLAAWSAFGRSADTTARLVASVEEIRNAKRDGVLAIGLHAQGLDAIGSNVDLLNVYYELGVRVAQPTYNYRNALGNGCFELGNDGLSVIGRDVVHRANELGMVLDISHVGVRTSLDILELSAQPVIASHSNARRLCDNPRNLGDDQIREVARSAGVVGLCAFSAFVAHEHATVERLVDHAAYIADLVGVKHVALGFDFSDEDEEDFERYRYDERFYPHPPWSWPTGIEDWTQVPNLADALAARGFAPSEVAGILGENVLRVFKDVWGK